MSICTIHNSLDFITLRSAVQICSSVRFKALQKWGAFLFSCLDAGFKRTGVKVRFPKLITLCVTNEVENTKIDMLLTHLVTHLSAKQEPYG